MRKLYHTAAVLSLGIAFVGSGTAQAQGYNLVQVSASRTPSAQPQPTGYGPARIVSVNGTASSGSSTQTRIIYGNQIVGYTCAPVNTPNPHRVTCSYVPAQQRVPIGTETTRCRWTPGATVAIPLPPAGVIKVQTTMSTCQTTRQYYR